MVPLRIAENRRQIPLSTGAHIGPTPPRDNSAAFTHRTSDIDSSRPQPGRDPMEVMSSLHDVLACRVHSFEGRMLPRGRRCARSKLKDASARLVLQLCVRVGRNGTAPRTRAGKTPRECAHPAAELILKFPWRVRPDYEIAFLPEMRQRAYERRWRIADPAAHVSEMRDVRLLPCPQQEALIAHHHSRPQSLTDCHAVPSSLISPPDTG